MKTKNIIWGLVLVLIGLLFILKNLDVIYFSWYSIWKLWPMVLVIIGIAILPVKGGIKIALTIVTLVIAAIGVWFGGWIDGLIQRLTEINMILPMFPALLLVYTLYSKSFWVLLGVTVLLSIFGSGIKNYRSLFIQIKELPYFEVAKSYGASDWRIIFRYLIPRIGAIIIPQLVILVPSYVFLEAGLAVLGLYDPLTPPTWGQLVMDGLTHGIQQGALHLALEPAFLLLLTGYAFLLLGISLERVFEPRLRER